MRLQSSPAEVRVVYNKKNYVFYPSLQTWTSAYWIMTTVLKVVQTILVATSVSVMMDIVWILTNTHAMVHSAQIFTHLNFLF